MNAFQSVVPRGTGACAPTIRLRPGDSLDIRGRVRTKKMDDENVRFIMSPRVTELDRINKTLERSQRFRMDRGNGSIHRHF